MTISKLKEMDPMGDDALLDEVNKTAEEVAQGIDLKDDEEQKEVEILDLSGNNPVFKSNCK